MKTTNGTLNAYLLNNAVYTMCDLVTITPVSGSVIRLTDADVDITLSGNTYYHNTYQFKRSNTKIHIGLQVDEMDFTIFDIGSNLINTHTLYQSCVNGYFDNAQIKVERLFNCYGSTISDLYKLWMFEGNVSAANPSRYEIKLKVKSEIEKLNLPTPRNLYQPTCVNTLFDTNCGLNSGTYIKDGTIGTVTSSTVFQATLSTTPTANYYDLGYITCTSGANDGVKRSIKTQIGTTTVTLTLFYPLPYTPTAADTFTILPGCSKLYVATSPNPEMGCTKYSNTANFRGFDYIPRNEDAQ
jgi:uncharacterized phage protein (TIGR02218 family)